MKRLTVFLLIMLALPIRSMADLIYGSLSINGTPVQRAQIYILADEQKYSAITELDGSYRIFVRQPGKVQLIIYYKNKEGKFIVVSYGEPVRYDFELVENPSNPTVYTLVRK